MNCEKCKNKKATLFYADDTGGRHALCALCGERQSKLLDLKSHVEEPKTEKEDPFLPQNILLSFISTENRLSTPYQKSAKGISCKGCGLTEEALKNSGEASCPDCYEAFSSLIFPPPIPTSAATKARMPSTRRKKLDKQKRLTELKVELRHEIDKENYEAAAELRDQIKELENS